MVRSIACDPVFTHGRPKPYRLRVLLARPGGAAYARSMASRRTGPVVVHGPTLTPDDARTLAGMIAAEVLIEDLPAKYGEFDHGVAIGGDFSYVDPVSAQELLTIMLSAGTGAIAKHTIDGIVAWARQRARNRRRPCTVRIYDRKAPY
jgi:hypothetical protein